MVAGQTLGGVVFDLAGLGPGGRRPMTPTRVLGAILALAAIAWAVSGRIGDTDSIVLMLFPFIAGFGTAWQQAVNGRVRTAASSAFTATLVNFTVGTTALVIVALVHVASAGLPSPLPSDPWFYTGGAIGCIFIAVAAVVVRIVGVLLLALATVAGQLAAALALDLFAPVAGATVDTATIGGTLLALAAVVVASVRWRGPRHAAPANDGLRTPR